MKPPPFIIDKEGVRLIFNEPHDKGALSLEMGSGGLCIFLDAAELKRLSKVLWYAGNRLA
jgi:hypothetical protein